MRTPLASSLIALLLSAPAAGQALTCPSSAGIGGADCNVIHYHVLSFKPSSKRAFELYGLNRFSSASVCEAARARDEAENRAVVAAIKKVSPKKPIEVHRYGPCHCDMTESTANAYFLDAAKREAQVRLHEQIRRELRGELLEAGLSTDAPEVQSLATKPSAFRSSAWPKFLAPPPAASVKFLDPEATVLQDTEASRTRPQKATISNEIQLVAVQPAEGGPEAAPTAVAVIPELAPGEAFVTRETERVQAILGQSGDLGDDSLKGQVFEALMQRLQALSNLRSLVTAAGAKSRLALRLDSISSDDASLALVALLFGDTIRAHWEPTGPEGAIVSLPPEISNDPVAVLRDSSDRFDTTQRRAALYLILARNPTLSPGEQLWLSQFVEASLE